jgi:predicted RNase H-like HicB family nuclease
MARASHHLSTPHGRLLPQRTVVEWDADLDLYLASAPELPGYHGSGPTRLAAVDALRLAIEQGGEQATPDDTENS